MSDKTHRLKPFLRWAGGKQWIAKQLASLIPSDIGTYYEPFLGGGSLFFTALPDRAVLSDLNQRLIETYRSLRDQSDEVIEVLSAWLNDEQTYYDVRETAFEDSTRRAAQFIYLNRTCWNGLYRVNKQGEFNVPFGNHGRRVFDERHLADVSKNLKNVTIRHADFDQVLYCAEAGDFVYLDPPYTALHAKNGFLQYNERLFNWEDQQRLGHTAVELANRGCIVLVSNANHESVLELYPDFVHMEVSRKSVLAADSRFRRKTSELLLASDRRILTQEHLRFPSAYD